MGVGDLGIISTYLRRITMGVGDLDIIKYIPLKEPVPWAWVVWAQVSLSSVRSAVLLVAPLHAFGCPSSPETTKM